jgi:VIT1/CCC1 family predicted Fe2+/Mn2+ transporter
MPINQQCAWRKTGACGFAADIAAALRLLITGAVGRPSIHVEPSGTVAIARHYMRDLIYGANDGIITTFAVVAGVTGGALSHATILVVGAANLAADGLSMAVGNFLSIRAHESAREAENLPEEEAHAWKHAIATFAAFVVAGALPLLPFALAPRATDLFVWSSVLTMAALFGVGAIRTLVTVDRWWKAGGEMLLLGALVAAAAYFSGAFVAHVLS